MAASDEQHYDIAPVELQISKKLLGDGLYSCVYEAIWNGAPVAVKCIHERIRQCEMAQDRAAEALEKLRQELSVMVRIHHPNIVQLFGVYSPDSGSVGIVMELMQISLYERALKRRPRVEPRLTDVEVADILRDMSTALAYLHSRNILHRDVSPKNTLLYEDARQRRLVAKLSDFAGSKILRKIGCEQPRLSSLSGMVGTQPYLPWEAIERDTATGKVKYDSGVDVYGVGAVGLAALLGEEPGVTPKKKPDFLKRLGKEHFLFDILSECLHDISAKRPSSAVLRARLETVKDSLLYPRRKEQVQQTEQAHRREPSKANRSIVENGVHTTQDRLQLLENELRATEQELVIAKQTLSTAGAKRARSEKSRNNVLLDILNWLPGAGCDPLGCMLRGLAAYFNTATFVTSLADIGDFTDDLPNECVQGGVSVAVTSSVASLQAGATREGATSGDQHRSEAEQVIHEMCAVLESTEARARAAEERVLSLEQQLQALHQSQAASCQILKTEQVPASTCQLTSGQHSALSTSAPTLKSYPYRLLPAIPGDGKRNHKSVCVGRWIILLSGYNKMGNYCQHVFAYDTLANHWKKWPPVPFAYCAAASDDDHLYVAGGRTSQSSVSEVFYLTKERHWKRLPDLPHSVFFASAAYLKRKLYVFSGSHSQPGLLQVFDFKERKWSLAAAAPRELQPTECSGVLIPWGDLLVTDQFAYYDTKQNSWHRLPQREAGMTAAMAVANDELVAVGVHFGGGEFSVDALASIQSTWSSLGRLPTKRCGAAVCTKDNMLFVTGGHRTENIFECIWQQ